MTGIEFDVFGTPGTAGSKTAVVRGGKAVMFSSSKTVAPWRQDVVAAARAAMPADWVPLTGPIMLNMTIWLPRPKTAPKTVDILPAKGLDIDKLMRGTADAMTNAGVWVDDSQITFAILSKFYSVGPDLTHIYKPEFHRPPGVAIVVRQIANTATGEETE